jgi:hypothetical protein
LAKSVALGKKFVPKEEKLEANPLTSFKVLPSKLALEPNYKAFIEQNLEGEEVQNWVLEVGGYLFRDNVGVSYNSFNFKLSRRLGQFTIYPKFGIYHIDDNGENYTHHWGGGGVKYRHFTFEADSDGGYLLRYESPLGITATYSRAQLLPSRKSYCSKDHKVNKFEISYYKQFEPRRELWASLAYEWIDDGNRVFTPQFDWDLWKFSRKGWEIVPNLSGWYQFSSATTSCYYSPKRADTNLINLKIYRDLTNSLYFYSKIGVGYSFYDNIWTREVDIYLKGKNGFQIGCEFSRNSSRNGKPYETRECKLQIVKGW